MIKLFTPESFNDYIRTVVGSTNSGGVAEVYDSTSMSDSIHSFGMASGSMDGEIHHLNGYFEPSVVGEIENSSLSGDVSSSIGDDSGGEGEIIDDDIIDPMDYRPSFLGNGDVILRPSDCKIEAELNGNWKLTLTHPFDSEGRYTYISKGSVIVLPVKLAREQQDDEQCFRIYQVKETQSGIEATAYPVIYESIYETPIEYLEMENVTAEEFKNAIQTIVSRKYYIDLIDDFGGDKESIYIENSNLQETINGSQEGTFTSLYNAEVVYDNYNYRLSKHIGNSENSKDYIFSYAHNITGINVTESTDEMATRIYPMSSEGVTVSDGFHVDSTNIDKYPIAYAKSIKYSDIKLVDEKSEGDDTPETAMQIATREVKAAITAKVNELSLKYLKRARAGLWDDTVIYQDRTIYNRHNPTRGYSYADTRRRLPYGYIFYSYTDAIGVLTQKVLTDVITIDEEKALFEDAIKDGFKWCETTEIAGYDWRTNVIYNDPEFDKFRTYSWLQDSVGWWYGDGNGNYLTNCWVEDDTSSHYWVGSDGYWDPQWDDHDEWKWYQTDGQWWYGDKNSDGTTKNYAKSQYIFVTQNGNTYWFDENGYFVDGDDKRWGYGTKDGSDVVTNQYWTVGSETWWFNENGEIDNTIAYATKFDWRTDDHGKYYGDGQGHWLANCWVEDDDNKHRWIDEDGYYYGVDDESSPLGRYDGQQWTWHGNWGDGWWYGDNYEDANSNSSSSGSSETTTGSGDSSSSSETETGNIGLNIGSLGTNLLPEYTGIDSIFTSKKDVSGMETSAIQKCLSQGYMYIMNNKYIAKLKTRITDVTSLPPGLVENLQDMGYKFNEEQTELYLPETVTSPSGEDLDPEQKTGLKNYVWGQFMYVSSYNKWYWFDVEGYYVDCWMAKDNWEWHTDSLGWWYGDGAGTYPQGQWMKIGGKWYFFDEDGYADETTDDFEDPKNGSYESATYDSNREGIKASSTKKEDDEVVYDDTREGVRAWIQDDFVNELITAVIEQSNYLHNKLKDELVSAAKEDLKESDHPKYSVSIDFVTLANSSEYAKFAFLKDLYLGDTILCKFAIGGIYSNDRVTALQYDCLKKDITNITIGNPTKTFFQSLVQLSPKGTLKKWKPEYGLADGYGGYLLTGFAGTNLSVR